MSLLQDIIEDFNEQFENLKKEYKCFDGAMEQQKKIKRLIAYAEGYINICYKNIIPQKGVGNESIRLALAKMLGHSKYWRQVLVSKKFDCAAAGWQY